MNSFFDDFPEPAPLSETDEAIHQYEVHMENVKRMGAVVRRGIKAWESDETLTGYSQADVYLCYLMLRMICESMMLASVMVHDAFLGTLRKRIVTKEWNADRIVKEIERVNPEWYPRPVVLKNILRERPLTLLEFNQVPEMGFGFNHVDLRPSGGWLTKGEFTKLCSTCNGYLHARGQGHTRRDVAMDNVADACSGLALLSKNHMVCLSDDVDLLVEMTGPWKGRVTVLDLYSAPE